MTTIDHLDKILYYLHCEVPHKKSLSEILKVVFQDNPQIPLTQLVAHLLEEKLLFQELDAYRSSASQALYGITVRGIQPFERSPKTTRPLYDLDMMQAIQREKDQKLRDNQLLNTTSERWVKKYWWVMLVIGWVGGCWTDIAKEGIKKKLWKESKNTVEKVKNLNSTRK